MEQRRLETSEFAKVHEPQFHGVRLATGALLLGVAFFFCLLFAGTVNVAVGSQGELAAAFLL